MYIYTYLEPQMNPIFEGQPPKTMAFPIKTRVHLGSIHTWNLIHFHIFQASFLFKKKLRGGLKYVLFSSLPGEMIQFDDCAYFSDGLGNQPPN